jgi:hypothetical protein
MFAAFLDADILGGPIETGIRANGKVQGTRIDAKGQLLFRPADGDINVPAVEGRVGDDGRGMAGQALSRPDGAGVIGRKCGRGRYRRPHRVTRTATRVRQPCWSASALKSRARDARRRHSIFQFGHLSIGDVALQ